MAVIFYLSGTGNSLYAAKTLQGAFPDCRMEKMGAYLKQPYEVTDEVIGIVCPVYCFSLPPAVEKFIAELKAKPKYCFGIVTMGGNQGYALKQMQKCLHVRGISLNYACDIIMPDNFFAAALKVRDRMLAAAEQKLPAVKQDLQLRVENTSRVKGAWVWESFGTALAWKYMDKMLQINNLFADNKCIGCGTCSKVCPMDNIKLVDNRAVFGSNCAHCLGCLHWCPVQAVHAGKKTVKANATYHHPQIKLEDM